ncbi:uncharacterized protein B0H18DRAFT_962978 [Fomitopsis serialis]|uniref:uncharacterized protein n=1 Tax=Fomitopsis serialis TaxID=139415 RepID=UPI002008AD93|nr:uncharacterized protein B0H18DRAFT_962978 [Neoantrodia serialis]KAH9910671.1 hypothetical protein B0H18DRAFT_962978 [Neoantrodia serialis]
MARAGMRTTHADRERVGPVPHTQTRPASRRADNWTGEQARGQATVYADRERAGRMPSTQAQSTNTGRRESSGRTDGRVGTGHATTYNTPTAGKQAGGPRSGRQHARRPRAHGANAQHASVTNERTARPGRAQHANHEHTGPGPGVQTQLTSAPWVREQQRARRRACRWYHRGTPTRGPPPTLAVNPGRVRVTPPAGTGTRVAGAASEGSGGRMGWQMTALVATAHTDRERSGRIPSTQTRPANAHAEPRKHGRQANHGRMSKGWVMTTEVDGGRGWVGDNGQGQQTGTRHMVTANTTHAAIASGFRARARTEGTARAGHG